MHYTITGPRVIADSIARCGFACLLSIWRGALRWADEEQTGLSTQPQKEV